MNDSLNKKYYKIREVSEMLGLPDSTLRFWEKEFPALKPQRNSHGIRFYTPADIELIRMINYLIREKGLKIEAAKEEMRVNRDGVSRQHEVVDRLRSVRSQLVELIESLHALR